MHTRDRAGRAAVRAGLRLLALAASVVPAAGSAAPDAPPATWAAEEAMEKPSDPPLYLEKPLPTVPPARPQLGDFTSVQVNVAAGGMNILGDAANEPTIAVDPKNPNVLAIGWRQFDTVLSNFRQAGRAYSTDGGRSWRNGSVLQPGVFRSDPVLAFDANGTFYYSSLTSGASSITCDVFTSTNGGRQWLGPNPAYGGDKQWIAVDRTGGVGHGNLYEAWAIAGACCGTNTFTRSIDGGYAFINPINIPSTPQWGSMDVGPDGAVYIAGVDPRNLGRVLVGKSTTAQNGDYLPLFDFVHIVDLGGRAVVSAGDLTPNPDGLLGQIWLAVDPSSGPTAGWIYLVAALDPPGPDPIDVFFARSTDGAQTFSPPVRLNDDAPGAWQWMATMAVAPNGRLDVVWNDSRNTGAANLSELYYCVSVDGGTHWSGNARLSPPWDSHVGWPNQQKIGDYYHMLSDRVGTDLAWAATFNGEQDIWFLRIGDRDCNGNGVGDATDIALRTSHDWNQNDIPDECENLQVSDAEMSPPAARLLQNVPNPFNPSTTIAFELAAAGPARIDIFDIAGRRVRTLEVDAHAGHNAVLWDGTDASGRGADSGVYVYRLRAARDSATRRMVLVR